ncbi:hypothetical protein Trydic_g19680 [Trypoxylus dichotomus]
MVEESSGYSPDDVHEWFHSGVFLNGGVPYESESVEGSPHCLVLERFEFLYGGGRSGCPHGGSVPSVAPPLTDRGFSTADLRDRDNGVCGLLSSLGNPM